MSATNNSHATADDTATNDNALHEYVFKREQEMFDREERPLERKENERQREANEKLREEKEKQREENEKQRKHELEIVRLRQNPHNNPPGRRPGSNASGTRRGSNSSLNDDSDNSDAIRLADEYSLTHSLGDSKKKNNLSSCKMQYRKSSYSNSNTGKYDHQYYCYTCGKPDHTARFCKSKWESSSSEIICYRCNKKGHIARNCIVEKKNVKKPVSLVNNLSSRINDILKETRKLY
ncbi:uncharacterized protein [Palaemon carinicauda]|uniref:uncharacterized protein n=1 Tax=Palaemon carinicauda TaxID=392227 RepID=UPI0035B5B1BB